MNRLTELEEKIEAVSAKLKEAEIKKTADREEWMEEWIFLVAEADLLRLEETEEGWNQIHPDLWWTRP